MWNPKNKTDENEQTFKNQKQLQIQGPKVVARVEGGRGKKEIDERGYEGQTSSCKTSESQV